MMSYMGQLTIYLPDEVEKRYRRNAKRAKKTISAYIASLEKTAEPKDANGHPLAIRELFGSVPDFEVPPRDRTPPRIPDLEPALPARQRRVRRTAKGR